MGRSGGVTGGKDGNMHFGDPELGCVGMVSMLPDMALVATGMALAFKTRGESRVAMTFFGEGSTANGQWHEAMNLAGVQRLPVVFVLENNQFAYSTPNELEFAVDPVERAEDLRVPRRERGRQRRRGSVRRRPRRRSSAPATGGGPTLIEAQTMRMHGHGAHDDMSYVPPEMFEEWSARDPIERYAERLVADHGFSADEVDSIRAEVKALRRRLRQAGARLADAGPGDGHRRASSPTTGSRSATAGRRGRAGRRESGAAA